ncbi:hypothetical protein DERF_014183 [Dermatophagoides farinae]|uniref:Uncharacterized protein n=1 Tax=Dermatophagoides farinae TaxID=6954 RepID=A0A922KTU4_DERFA|nr:hypothetical protein DERF_014183 [Dermatophagoides farinae]
MKDYHTPPPPPPQTLEFHAMEWRIHWLTFYFFLMCIDGSVDVSQYMGRRSLQFYLSISGCPSYNDNDNRFRCTNVEFQNEIVCRYDPYDVDDDSSIHVLHCGSNLYKNDEEK